MTTYKATSKDWQSAFITHRSTIREVVQALDKSSIQAAIAVNESGSLLGIITDGDIRRALLLGYNLEDSCDQIINRNPFTVKENVKDSEIISLFRENGIHQLPITNNLNIVVGVYLFDEIGDVEVLDNQFLIMAGGFGTRLKPYTDKTPKPMLKIGGKPILTNIIEKAYSQGFRKFLISTHYLSHVIKDYYRDGSDFGVSITYLDEKEPLGTAGCLKLFKDKPSLPIVITNADIITDANYADILSFHEHNKASATMAIRSFEWQNPFGVVDMSGTNIIGFREKPITKLYVNAGFYALSPICFDLLPMNISFDMPCLFDRIRSKNHTTIGFPLFEDWIDVGRPDDLKKAKELHSN